MAHSKTLIAIAAFPLVLRPIDADVPKIVDYLAQVYRKRAALAQAYSQECGFGGESDDKPGAGYACLIISSAVLKLPLAGARLRP